MFFSPKVHFAQNLYEKFFILGIPVLNKLPFSIFGALYLVLLKYPMNSLISVNIKGEKRQGG